MDQQTAYRESEPRGGDRVRFWRERRLDDLECLEARFRRHRYAPHVHETYAIGVIVEGVEAFRYRGAEHRAGAGQVVAVNPGELHDGRAAHDGFAYRMLYPSLGLVESIAREIWGASSRAPMLPRPVVDDPAIARRLIEAHRLLGTSAEPLAVDGALREALAGLLLRHADRAAPARARVASGAVRRACEYADAHLAERPTLDALAAVAGCDRFRLIRAFRRETGLTPHAFLVSRRIARARRMLPGDRPLAEVALACGFFDQSHLGRTFKAWYGITPGEYRRGAG